MDTNNTNVNSDSMLSFLDKYGSSEMNIKTKTAEDEQTNRINTSLWFYEQSYNPTTAVELRNKQHNASRVSKLASMIAQFWKDNWIAVTWSDSEIINQYISNLNPSIRWKVASRFADYTHSTEYIEDSKDFALEMGWREKSLWDYIVDWAKWVYDYVMYWPYKLWWWLRKLTNTANVAWNKENNQESYDIMNLAQERFWPLAWIDGYLSEEDWEDLQFEVDNNSASVEKQHNLSNIALDIWIWGVLSAANVMFPWTNLAIWVATQLPIAWDILWRANEKASDLWAFVNKAPILSNYRESLWDEASKMEFDSFVGNVIVWSILWTLWKNKWPIKDATWWKASNKNGWNWWGWTPTKEIIRDWVKDFANKTTAEELINEFNKAKEQEKTNALKTKDAITDKILGKEELNNAYKNNKYDYKAIQDSLDRLKWGENSEWWLEWLQKSVTKQKNTNIKNVNKLIKLNKTKFWKKEIMEWTKDANNPNGYDFISETLDLLEKLKWENTPKWLETEESAYIKNFREKYKNNEITDADIIELFRKWTNDVAIYKNKPWEYASEIKWNLPEQFRQLRKMWIDFVKNDLNKTNPTYWDLFSELEEAIHNDIITESYINNRVVDYKIWNSKVPYRWEWRWWLWSKVKWFGNKLYEWVKPWVKPTIVNIWKKILQIWDMDIMWVDSLLDEMLRDYDFINEVIWNKKYDQFRMKVDKLKKAKDDIINAKKAELEWNVNNLLNEAGEITQTNPTQEPLIKMSELEDAYKTTFAEIMEDLWATKAESKEITDTIQQSLFDI